MLVKFNIIQIMPNYYDELIKKIEQLLKENKVSEALSLIKEELSLPYVPKQYETKLNDLLSKLEPKKESKKTLFSRDELISIINEYKNHDINFILEISYGFEQYNWNGYEKEIEKIFNFDGLDKKVKCIIYNSLVVQNLSYDFKINQLVLNPTKTKTPFESDFAIRNLVLLSKKDFDDPSLLNICEKIFFIYIMNLFPDSVFFEFKDITNEIANIAKVMLGINKKEDLSTEEINIFNIIKSAN